MNGSTNPERHGILLGDGCNESENRLKNERRYTSMKRGFPRCLRIAAMAIYLCAFAISDYALAVDKNWQALVNEHATLMSLGQHERALEVALKSVVVAETDPDNGQGNLALSLYLSGSTYRELAQFDKALPLLQRALVILEKALGPEHPNTALILNNLALTYGALARHNDALPLLKRSLVIRERAYGPDHQETALSLNNLALTYVTLSQHDEALPLQQRALAIFEKTLGPKHPTTAQILNNLAETYRYLAQFDKALPLLQRALAILEKALSPEHPNTALILNNLALTYSALSRYDDALPLQQRALGIREKALGPEHPDTALSLNNLALTYGTLAQFDKALPLQQRALDIFEQTLGREHPSTASILNNLAATYGNLAQFEKALPLQQRALAIREKTLGPEHPDTALSLNNLADTYGKLAQYDKAKPLLERALAINDKVLGPEHPDTAWILGNLGSIYDDLAMYDKALLLHQRVLAIREKTLGPEHPNTAMALNNLASTYGKLGQHDKALPLEKRALAIHEKALGPEHPDTAWSLNNLAESYRHLAQYDKALPLLERALAIHETTLGRGHPATATSLNNLASTYQELAQFDKSLLLEQRALAIFVIALGSDHPDTAQMLNNLGITFVRMGQPELAVAFLKSAVNAYQHQREQISRIDAPALHSYTESVTASYQALATLLVDQGLLADAQLVLDMLKENEQFEFVGRNSSADPRLTRIGYNSNEQLWVTRYRQIADRLAALGAEEQALQEQAKLGDLSTEQKQRQQALASDLRVAQAAFDSFLKEMRENFGRQGPAKTAEANETSQGALRELQDLIKGIGPDTVLLQYYVTEEKVGMLLTTSGVQLARGTPVKAGELNRRIADFRRSLRNPKSNVIKESQALYQLLVAPVEQDLAQAGAKTVMLSPDGALRYLPFGALHDGQRYMVQRWNLPIYTSVTKNRLRDTGTAQWQAAGLGVTRALGEFKALPAVKNEMRSIFKSEGAGVLPGEVYLDEAFTAQRFKDVSQRAFQLLHVASHFQFSPGTEINSFLLLGDGQQLTLGDIRTQNYRFDNLDLLTLSACDTGLGGGRDAQGREIEGFGVIAQQQGAKAVLATLWPVADESTAKLMAEMYSGRQDQHQTKIESLRQAQLSLLGQSRYAHPFYWAPFILMGNWK